MTGDPVLRSIPDEVRGTPGFFHHIIAGIDAGRAADAFHLGAIADVYPRGADIHALEAVDAIARRFRFFPAELFPRLSPLIVVGDDHRVAVQQHALQPSVGADRRADLFPEIGIHCIEDSREDQHPEQPGDMLRHRAGNDLPEPFDPDDISKKSVCDNKRQEIKNPVLGGFLSDLRTRPGCFGQQFLPGGVSFYQILDLPEQHFHKDGLWAYPTAEQPSEGRGEQDHENDKSHHRQSEDEEILGPEYLTENNESCVRYIEKEEWLSIHINKGHGKEQQEKSPAYIGPQVIPFSLWLPGVDPFTMSRGVHCRQVVPEGIRIRCGDRSCRRFIISLHNSSFSICYLARVPSGGLAFGGFVPPSDFT